MSKRKSLTKKFGHLVWLILPVFMLAFFGRFILASANTIEVAADENTMDIMEPHLNKFVWRGGGIVTFWFDDAWSSQYETAYPLLEAAKYKAALAIPTKLVNYEAYMNWYQIRKVYFKGWEVMSHSRTHNCDLVDGSIEEIQQEIVGGKTDLIDQSGIVSNIYVAPCGRSSENANQIIRDNFTYQRLVEPGINPLPIRNKYEIKVHEVSVTHEVTAEDVQAWINEAKAARSWLILMFHQVDYEGEEHSTTPETLIEIINVVKKSGIQVALPSQVLNIR